jgi:hypothetical protein
VANAFHSIPQTDESHFELSSPAICHARGI